MNPELIYVKTNLNGIFFDAFLSMTHESDLTVTTHPVQQGASVFGKVSVRQSLKSHTAKNWCFGILLCCIRKRILFESLSCITSLMCVRKVSGT